jgi:hypothetical protein
MGRIGSRSREGLRSSDTAKFNARYEDFFTARADLHQEAIFPLSKEFG